MMVSSVGVCWSPRGRQSLDASPTAARMQLGPATTDGKFPIPRISGGVPSKTSILLLFVGGRTPSKSPNSTQPCSSLCRFQTTSLAMLPRSSLRVCGLAVRPQFHQTRVNSHCKLTSCGPRLEAASSRQDYWWMPVNNQTS